MNDQDQPIRLSLIIPLYNRPDEIRELLDSLVHQTAQPFEVIVVEDGSSVPSESIVQGFTDRLNVRYITKPNGGPGPARNFGAEHAAGNYLVFLDSDCVIPAEYISNVLKSLEFYYTDAYGGPDRAHASFTPVQKSINYGMTSFLTTGGIRGSTRSMEKFHPRSFNMGISAAVFNKLKGFAKMRFGEDVDLSMRIMEAGYTTQLIESAYVYHKRRTNFRQFFKQVHNSGIARINLEQRHPGTLKPVHALPAVFTIGSIVSVVLGVLWHPAWLIPLFLYILAVISDAAVKERSLKVAVLSILAVFTQLFGYGTGFIAAFWKTRILRRPATEAFSETFYD